MNTLKRKSIFYNKSISGSSSLLIPDYLINFFLFQKSRFGNIRNYFSFLIQNYGFTKEYIYIHSRIKTIYQVENLNLQKVNFCPFDADWLKIKLLAQAQSCSITLLFVILVMRHKMEMESGVEKTQLTPKTGVPINSNKLHLSQTIQTSELFKFQKKLLL